MKEKPITTVKKLPDGTIVRVMPDGSVAPVTETSDWNRLNRMTEEEIEAGAQSDPDNPPFSAGELKRLKSAPDIKKIRKRLEMTQEQFARSFHLPLGTVRDWEQGAKHPDTAARVLLHVIAKDPQAVLHAIQDR